MAKASSLEASRGTVGGPLPAGLVVADGQRKRLTLIAVPKSYAAGRAVPRGDRATLKGGGVTKTPCVKDYSRRPWKEGQPVPTQTPLDEIRDREWRQQKIRALRGRVDVVIVMG